MILICFLVCILSTMVGAISGIGGGVIIKPMLDLALPLGMARISLLSSCAVLCMSLFSIGKNYLQKNGQPIVMRTALPLAAGSTAGGVLGKLLFQRVMAALPSDDAVKLIQNGVLFALMLVVLLSTLRKKGEGAPVERPPWAGLCLSFALGVLAAFLGIGGGPLNMLALTAFYGMTHKEGALYSLFIIVFSQTAGLVTAALSHTVMPDAALLWTACLSGVLGGVIGRAFAKKLSNRTVRTLYCGALVVILAVSLLNMVG